MTQGLAQATRLHSLPVIYQTEATECGLACLAMIACFYRYEIDLNTLRRQYPVSLKGVTLKALMQIAGQLQFACRALRFEMEHLPRLQLPAIVHWDMDHFVVLKKVSGKSIVIHDPARGQRRLRLAEASKHLTGVALELTPSEGFEPRNEAVRLPLSSFWRHMTGSHGALIQVFLLSVVLEAFAIASPFYLQVAVDEVIARGDFNFLLVLALGFGLLTAISVISAATRTYILLIVQNTLSLRMVTSLFRHLIRLPLAHFEKRHIGDILSRFSSTEPIKQLLAEGVIAALIDGTMAIATLVMIFVYSWKLAVVVLVSLVAYLILRLVLYRLFRERSEAQILAKAKEESTCIEAVRGIQSLKLFNRESEAEGRWLNRYADVISTGVRLGKAKIAFKTLNDAIFGLENIVTVYLGVTLAMDGSFTIGMIFAFMSYKRHFTEKSVQLVEKALDFRLLELHLERIADIALSPQEPCHDRPLSYIKPILGQIEARNLCYRYADTEPLVLDNVNLKIQAGQFVTISGPSGGGKTTLLKILLGLIEPTSGEVLIDGLPLASLGARAYRESVGAVMQDDQLISGSIADNICFFDPAFDAEWMIECARTACIHDDIMAMPMTYNSLIGDMGSSLSGGQKQRLLLARALYRRPKILFLDEGTAHLDVNTEIRINECLKQLNITRVSAAHRPETIGAADSVILIGKN